MKVHTGDNFFMLKGDICNFTFKSTLKLLYTNALCEGHQGRIQDFCADVLGMSGGMQLRKYFGKYTSNGAIWRIFDIV